MEIRRRMNIDMEKLVEGMWALSSASVSEPTTMRDFGFLVLHAGRIIGAHQGTACAGTYILSDNLISASIEAWVWNPLFSKTSVFEVGSLETNPIRLNGQVTENFIGGELTSTLFPDVVLATGMAKICDFPTLP